MPKCTYNVLLVDDEPAILDVTKEVLEADGDLRVTTTDSPHAVEGLLASASIDVVISDYQMPDMDGIELLKALRSKGLSVPFILFTGKGREDVAVAALNNGANLYVRKGGDIAAQFAELKNSVRQLAHTRAVEALMQGIYEAAPVSIMLVDGDRRIQMLNRAASELSSIPRSALVGVRCGVAFGCDNAKEDGRGCGFGARCPDCRLWATVRRAIEAGEICRRVEVRIPTSADGVKKEVSLLVSAAPFVASRRTHAVVCIESAPAVDGRS